MVWYLVKHRDVTFTCTSCRNLQRFA